MEERTQQNYLRIFKNFVKQNVQQLQNPLLGDSLK